MKTSIKGKLLTTYWKYENEADKYQAERAWTINVEELKHLSKQKGARIETFILETDKALYITDRETVDKCARKVLGGEEKVVIPLQDWRMIIL